ncbi:MAG: BTAD domain-containing putative transcriptional regulator [Arthrobacter sp.]
MTLSSPKLRFLIGSRRSPRINLARSEYQTAVTVHGDDLRFRVTEIDQLFRTTYKQPLSPAGVSNLSRVTEGWAAALHLFHLATKNQSSVERRRAAESLSDTSRFARDYLTHHFLAGISAEMEELLRHTCVLDVLTPLRCDALLSRNDSRILLQKLERRGVISTGDDGATFRTPKVLRQYLLAGLDDAEPGMAGQLRQRTAAILEQEGAVSAALQVLAEARDWEGLRNLLQRAGTSAVLPGTCEWAALLPDGALPDEVWSTLARSRQMLDDGRIAAAVRAADKAQELTTDSECLRVARDLRRTAGLWIGGDGLHPADDPLCGLRRAVGGNPYDVARSLANQRRAGNMLPTGLSLLLAGDQRAAIPLLIQAAERLEADPASALAAQLALAVFGHDSSEPAAGGMAAEVDAVQRQAERRGFTWLGRLARGVQAALPGTPAAQMSVNAVIATCEERGDEWGAALVAAGGALMRLRTGATDVRSLEALALRFRRLSAGTLEAWAQSAQALVSAGLDLPDAFETVRTAEAFARAAAVPGALAVAYAALALQKPEDYGELMRQAAQTGQAAGLTCRPWTWLSPKRYELEATDSTNRTQTSGGEPAAEEGFRIAETRPGYSRLPTLDIVCFGGFSLRRDGVPVDLSKIRPQARTVLRILSLNAGRPVHRERLAGILWPDLDPLAALHALQVSVSCLRGALHLDGFSEGQQLLLRQGEAYALVRGTGSSFDLADFDQSMQAGALARSAGNNLGAAKELRRAVELYSGEVLPEDGPAEWVAETRERYRLRAAEAAASLACAELGLGNAAAAAAAATRSVEIDPWRDESWRTLVETFRRLGDPAAAQRAQQRYDLILNSLGVLPDYKSADPTAVLVTGPKTGPLQRTRTPPRAPLIPGS